jgi:membrane protease YdiL (CAAX protease family)
MNKSIRDTLTDLLAFLRNPRDEQYSDQSKQTKIKTLLTILALDIVLMIPLTCLISAFEIFGWIDSQDFKLINLFNRGPFWLIFIFIIAIGPFLEEIVFRLFLRNRRNYLLRFISNFLPKHKIALFDWWSKKYRYFFYLSSILFGLAHLSNYVTENIIIYIFPILVLPQFVMGTLLGYLRVKFDFMLGFFLHAIHNAISISIFLLTIYQSENHRLDINNDKYVLHIEEVSMFDYSGISKVDNTKEDSVSLKEVDLKSMIFYLTNVDLELIESNNKEILKKKLQVNFKNKSKVKINRDSIILNHLGELYLFKLEKKRRKQKLQVLYTSDNSKLLKYAAKNNSILDTKEIMASSWVLKYKNHSLPEITKSLSHNYEMHFDCDINLSQKFNITLPNGDIDKLKKTLKADYGIEIREKEEIVDYLFVNCKEK